MIQILNPDKVDKIMLDGPVKLNLGSGHHNYLDYINIDINTEVSTNLDIVGDITDLSYFPDGSVDEIVCYPVVEHLGHRVTPVFLMECYKKLKIGGQLIIETPDLSEAIEQFAKIRHNSGEIKGDFGDGSIYETLYGGQKDRGSFHLGCFTKYHMMCMLKWAGWNEPYVIPEPPRRGVEYGYKWNMRLRCVK